MANSSASGSKPSAPRQQHDPRYRVFLYTHRSSPWRLPFPRPQSGGHGDGGHGYAVTTLDVGADEMPGETLVRANESARALAGEHSLWSIALVLGESVGEPDAETLLWLDGTDYTVAPQDITEASQWRARAAMQNRYLKAHRDPRESPRLPNGQRVIRLFPDYGREWPLSESFSASYLLSATDLGLSDSLSSDLHAWNAVWVNRDPEYGILPPDWQSTGWLLFRRLQDELGETAEVRPDFAR